MKATTASQRAPSAMTFDQAAQLDPDEQAGELADGVWIPMTRNTWRHGEIVLNVAMLLKAYSKSHPGWSVAVADPGVKLATSPDRLRGPDVAMVRTERVPRGKGAEGWLDGAPDIAVEVAGDSQSISDLTKKALEYLTAGAKMVWVVDAEPKRLALFTPPDHVRILGPEDDLVGGDVLPGFSCAISEMF